MSDKQNEDQKQWFLYVADHHEGPFSEDEIKKLVKKGEAKQSSFVWRDGYADWVMMSDVSEFGGNGTPLGDSHGPVTVAPSVVSSGAMQIETVPVIDDQTNSSIDIGGVSASANVWCLQAHKSFSGPYSLKTIVRKINEGEIATYDSVWKEGWTSFIKIEEIGAFMQQVKPDRIAGAKNKKGNSAATALGLKGSGPSVRSYRWYRSTKFSVLLMLTVIISLYQVIAMGIVDQGLESVGILKPIKEAQLQPLQIKSIRPYVDLALGKLAAFLPEPYRAMLSTVTIPDGIPSAVADRMREVASLPVAVNPSAVLGLILSDQTAPQVVVAANATEGATFEVSMASVEGTLLSTASYHASKSVQIEKKIARTTAFSFDGGKPFPKGEYSIQLSQVGNPVPLVTERIFLGGPKDELYLQRLKDFNEKLNTKRQAERDELRQTLATIESMANESATKFFALAKSPNSPKRNATWKQYSANYSKLSNQVKLIVFKTDVALKDLYLQSVAVYQMSEKLHGAETDFIEKGGEMADVRQLASQIVGALNDLRNEIK